MQSVSRLYVRYVNGLYRRTGTLFEGRFKSSLVDSECYLLTCMCYIELNPVRAGMVTKSEDYRWSSHWHHIAVSTIDWSSEPEEYRRLAPSLKARALAYQKLFKQALSGHEIEAIRTHLNKGCVLGSAKFQDEIETILQRRTKIAPLGRPKNVKDIIMN